METVGDLSELVDADVEHLYCSVGLLCPLFKSWSHGFACEVPIGIEVDENGQLDGASDGVEFFHRFELDNV